MDSFYTILRNLNTGNREHDITHLTFFNVGACGYGKRGGGEKAQRVFQDRSEIFSKKAEELGLEFVTLNSNVYDFMPMPFNWIHSFRSMGAALALQKLFRHYYYSSAFPLSSFKVEYHSSGRYDLLNVEAFSTESLRFHSVGLWESRMDKVQFISEYPITYHTLNVCNNHATNCRTCDKCIRTMGELYALNKLGSYSEVFDVEYFNAHLSSYMSKIISKRFDGSVESEYNKEILDKMKENGLKIPLSSYFKAVPMIVVGSAMNIARNSRMLTKYNHKRIHEMDGLYYNDL